MSASGPIIDIEVTLRNVRSGHSSEQCDVRFVAGSSLTQCSIKLINGPAALE